MGTSNEVESSILVNGNVNNERWYRQYVNIGMSIEVNSSIIINGNVNTER